MSSPGWRSLIRQAVPGGHDPVLARSTSRRYASSSVGVEVARLDLGRGAALDDPAPGQHTHRVGRLRLLQVVRGQEHGGAGRGPGLPQVAPQAPPASGSRPAVGSSRNSTGGR